MSFRTFQKPLAVSALALLAGFGAACGSTPPPPELLDARSAYLRAQNGPAAQLKPDSLHEAKVALDKAERAYVDDPDSQRTKDVAYLAIRSSELAEVEARQSKAMQDKARAEQELAGLTQVQLSRTRQQLASATDKLSGTEQQLAQERAQREAADKRAREALDRLGNVKTESRGSVITIPGNVLFTSGKSTVLPGAQQRLNTVADALKDQSDHDIVVEGHTDSNGSDAFNLELSQSRAQAVRDYLVSRGVPSERIRAQGVGETRPVADNSTAEGRANNRRVEIIVSPSAGEGKGATTIDTPAPADRKPSPGGTMTPNK
jgi:outer membrane protein OmpA-like peptidoglycan-associated protein